MEANYNIVVVFAIHWHESATGVHVFPRPEPLSHLPPHPIPQGLPSAPAPSTLSHALNLDWRSISYMITCMIQYYSLNHPTLTFSHRVQKSVLYICVSFAVSHIGSLLPSFGDGQGGLACCDSWGRKESDTTEWLNWTELMEIRKMVTMTLFVRQQKRHRYKEQTFGLCGRRQGWNDLRE